MHPFASLRRRCKIIAATLCVGLGLLMGQAHAQDTVAAAASLKPVLEPLATQFKREKGLTIEIVFDASGNLAKQIEVGAPYDVFLSADEKWPRYLEGKGRLERIRPIAACPLVLWWAGKTAPAMEAITDKRRRVAIADPVAAPFGKLAKEFLTSKGWFDGLEKEARLIIGGDVLKTGLAAKSGGADLALLPESVALELREGTWTRVPVPPQKLFGGLVKGRTSPAGKAFFDYLKSAAAAPFFRAAGFEQAE